MTWRRVPESVWDNPSCSVAKQSLPVLRMNTTRPATPTTSVVSSPVSRWRQRARTSRSAWVRGTETG